MLKKKKLAKKPKPAVGDLIDALYKQDKEIRKIEATVREAKSARAGIQEKLLELLGEQKLNGARGNFAIAKVTKTPHPGIENRPKFLKWVVANKAFDLFQNRITSKAYFDRIENGEFIPGVKIGHSIRVSVVKAK